MIELGLQRISRLLYDTPLPWRAIHVAGTNGKGSVCSYISEMLNAYNRSRWRKSTGHQPIRHGRFTSPHLVDRWDCIQLSNHDRMKVVSPDVFLGVETAVQARSQHQNIKASEFELLTATAFETFTRAGLDIGVVEVGMGGRLDSSNVIGQPITDMDGEVREDVDMNHYRPPPLMTAITRIGKDHQQFLGDTYANIAFEKAGIIKPGVPLTFYQQQDTPEVVDVFRQRAQQLDAPVILPDHVHLPDVQDVNLSSGWRTCNGEIALTCTWTSLIKLGRLPQTLPARETREYTKIQDLCRDMKLVIRDYIFPGRQEALSLAPLTGFPGKVLLDGAHNQQGIELLAERVRDLRGRHHSQPIVIVTAISNSVDRKSKDILEPLLRPGDTIFAVEFGPVDGMPWVEAQNSADTIEVAKGLVPELHSARAYGRDIAGALQDASDVAKSQGSSIVICGSLYLAGEIHRLLRRVER